MNWSAISAIAGIFSSVAVMITVVYLAIEIRHNAQVAKRSIVKKNRGVGSYGKVLLDFYWH